MMQFSSRIIAYKIEKVSATCPLSPQEPYQTDFVEQAGNLHEYTEITKGYVRLENGYPAAWLKTFP
jgi:hypothetical protein